jgi:integrase
MNPNKTMWLGAYIEYQIQNGEEIRVRKQVTLSPAKKGDGTKITKRDAQRLFQPYVDKANSPATEMKKSISFSKFSDVWERDYLSLNKPATRQVTQSYLKRLREVWGSRDMRTIDAGDVQQLIARMQTEGLVAKSIRNVWSVVSRIWQAAHTQRYVDAVLPKPKLPRNHKKKVKCFTLSDVAQLIARSGRENRVFYWLLAETGLRSGEVAGLTAEDVDLDGQRLMVNRSVYRGREQRPKTDNAIRTLALSSQLTALLREQIALQGQGAQGHRYIFSGRDGAPRQMNAYSNRRMRKQLEEIGIDHKGFHAFRHFNAGLMDALRVPLRTIQERIGHASTGSFTLDVYGGRPDFDRNKEAAAAMGDQLEAVVRSADVLLICTNEPQVIDLITAA